jgi:hypothetical protein
MKLKLITALALATFVAAPASAGPLKNAWVRQQVSITKGVVNGKLTPGEFGKLQRQQTRILKEARFLKSTGGGLGPLERAYLGARLIGARGAIYYHKHN